MLASRIFEGAAFYYARYQPEYPAELFELLVSNCGLSNKSRLLDLGCGTGQIGLGLAPKILEVNCVDPNREMLDEAMRIASEHGVRNISFFETTAEAIDPSMTNYDGATIASAFHWMDRSQVLQLLDKRLARSAKVAIITRVRDRCEPNDWWNSIWEFVHGWWGGFFPAGPDDKRRDIVKSNIEVLRESPFQSITSERLFYKVAWDTETLVQYIFSTSKACPGVLQDRKDDFEIAFRALLARLSPNSRFTEESYLDVLIGART